MLTRRTFGLYAATMTLPSSAHIEHAISAAEDPFPPLPPELAAASDERDFFSMELRQTVLGKLDPGKERRDFARAIMDAAPKNCRPIDVAYYFRDLGKGKTQFGAQGRPYARGWPRIYNPLIIELFTTTHLNPLAPEFNGDATPWCAAFVNYCIARALSKNGRIGDIELARGTQSASSGSFRCYGKEVKEGRLREGDIAVWALDGTVNKCKPGQGHVGFFVEASEDTRKPYMILGGNQSGDLLSGTDTRNDGIFLKAMPVQYLARKNPDRYKRLLGFRTDYL